VEHEQRRLCGRLYRNELEVVEVDAVNEELAGRNDAVVVERDGMEGSVRHGYEKL
jgi:hypothetical protein